VSRVSWVFDPEDSACQLVEDFQSLTGVEHFDLAIVLGSGWQVADNVGPVLGEINYKDWSCFPSGQVVGHQGRMIAIQSRPWNLLFFSGRFHCYQELNAYEASFPVRIAGALGCPRILLTCATGGINRSYAPGEFMLVEDHMNFLGDNPLRYLHGDSFVDMTAIYDLDLYDEILSEPPANKIHRGVLAAMPGPSYETPAEIGFLAGAGADVVSMSTVPEAIMARYLKMKIAAIAFISNYAAGMSSEKLNHKDVLECSSANSKHFPELVQSIVNGWKHLDNQNSD
jgi:purine-nucleoside phosphorylase